MLCFFVLRFGEERRIRAEFERDAKAVSVSIHRGLEASLLVVKSITHFYHANSSVSREQFQIFTKGALDEVPGIQALEWIPRVSQVLPANF